MRFPTLILFMPALAIGFTIPENQPPGVYQVSYVSGEEVHTLIGATTSDQTSTLAPLSAKFKPLLKRDAYACGGGNELNHADTDRANNALDAQCSGGTWVGGNLDFYSIVGCTVAYHCNFSAFGMVCDATSRRQASAGITGRCGWYRAGWTTYQDAPWSYGYEDHCTWPGSNFCGRGTG